MSLSRWAVAAVLWSQTAHAFEYNEHRAASRQAARAALSTPDGQALVRSTELLVTDRTGVPVCGAKLARSRPGLDYACFELADISGLAGDLSSRPGGMLSRFFTGQQFSIAPQTSNFLIAGGAALKTLLPSQLDSPSVVPTAVAKTLDILSVTADPYFDPKKGGDFKRSCEAYFATQFSLMERYGSQLTSLALANTSHFEISDLGAFSDLEHWRDVDVSSHFEARSVHISTVTFSSVMRPSVDQLESKQSAVSHYLELHGGAMLFQELAVATPSAKAAPLWRALALIDELYALHYLQDLAAPGHRLTTARALGHTALARRYAHNCLNREGDVFQVTALCDRLPVFQQYGLEVPALTASCAKEKKVKLLGDATATCNASTDTFDVLNALSTLSMLEVFHPEAFAARLSEDGGTGPGSHSDDLAGFIRARDVYSMNRDPIYDNDSLSSDASMSADKMSLYWLSERWDTYRANGLFHDQPKFKVLRHYISDGRFRALDAIPRRLNDSMVAQCEGEGAKSPMEVCNSYLDEVLKRVSACDTESRTARSRLGPKP